MYGGTHSNEPLLNDLFFNPFKGAVEGITNFLGNAWKRVPQKYKGVSPGGEEFIVKIDKALTKLKKNRPQFLKGTL